jgi:sulfate adenylyltransferase subunit 2
MGDYLGWRLPRKARAARAHSHHSTGSKASRSTSCARSRQCAHPALLFSGGKDSLVCLRLAEKAFRPAPFPFPLLHIDTGHNFPEVIAFRDRRAPKLASA